MRIARSLTSVFPKWTKVSTAGNVWGGRTAQHPQAMILVLQVFEQVITGIATIKQQHPAVGNLRQQRLDLLPLVGLGHGLDRSGNRQSTEDVIGRGHQALGACSLPRWSNPLWGSNAVRMALVPGRVSLEPAMAKTDRPCQVCRPRM